MPLCGREVCVIYSDLATVRSRLVSVAQQVRALLATEHAAGATGGAPGAPPGLPQLALPRSPRYGFWHMGFESEDAYVSARAVLRGRPFTSSCGFYSGTLVFEREAVAFDAVATTACCSLTATSAALDEAERWLAHRCAEFGLVDSARVPRLLSGWDAGVGTVTFEDADAAALAAASLDGTASFVPGDNLSAFAHAPYVAPADSFAGAARLAEQIRLLRIAPPADKEEAEVWAHGAAAQQ